MKQLWAVTKVTLNSSFGISALRWQYLRRRQRLWEPVLIIWGMGTAVAFLSYGAYRVYLAMASVGSLFGQPELPLGLATVSSQVLVLVMGFFLVVSSFYFSRDLPILVPLPLRPGAVITAKFLTILVGEYITISFFFWPAVIAYARFTPFGLGEAVVTLLVFLLLPVLPLAVTSLMAMTLMRSINRRHRDLLFYAGSILFFGAFLVWQMSIARLPQGDLQKYLESLVSARLGLVGAITSRFPPAFWSVAAIHDGLTADGLRSLLLVGGTAALSVAVLRVAGERLFYLGLIGGEEVSRGRRLGRGRAIEQAGARAGAGAEPVTLSCPRTPMRALIAREWMLILRTPVWVLNNVLPGVIVPLFMFVPLLASGQLQGDLEKLLALKGGQTYAGLVLAAILLFVGSLGGLAATSISREGSRIWISRVMPQQARTQAAAKLVMATTVAALSVVPSVVVFGLLLGLPALFLVLPVAISLTATLAANAIGLRVDMTRPMLRWKDPQEPVKRNLNGLVPGGLALLLLALGIPVSRALVGAGVSGLIVFAVLLVITGGMAFWSVSGVLNKAEEIAGRLEV
jgi:ABC-2 type transport system permease protein